MKTAAALCLLTLLPAAAPVVVVVQDGDSRPYREALAGVARAAARVEAVKSDDPSLAGRLARDDGAVFVALGPKAARALARAHKSAAAATLLRAGDAPEGVSSVALDLPPDLVARWIKRAFPGRTRVIVPVGVGAAAAAGLVAACDAVGLEAVVVEVADPRDAVPAVTRALATDARRSVLWLQPDKRVAGADGLSALVEAGLRARVPTVGFSAYLLRAGALAAVELDFAAMGEEAARRAAGAAPRAASAWAHLAVNARLAERLGVAVGDGEGVEVTR